MKFEKIIIVTLLSSILFISYASSQESEDFPPPSEIFEPPVIEPPVEPMMPEIDPQMQPPPPMPTPQPPQPASPVTRRDRERRLMGRRLSDDMNNRLDGTNQNAVPQNRFNINERLKDAKTGVDRKGEGLVSLDFDNVDIRIILKFMSELTNKNFLIDEKVRGKVTILSPKKISPDDAYKVLESILEVHGFAAVPSDNIIKIVPVQDGKGRAIETKKGKGEEDIYKDDRLITQLLPLDYADVNEIKNTIAPLISRNSHIISYIPTNTLIITDISSNIKRLADIIKELDVETVEFELAVIPLRYASSDDLASKLLSFVEASGNIGGRQLQPQPAGGGEVGRMPSQPAQRGTLPGGKKVIKAISDSRTNSIIVLATPNDIKMLKSLIEKLDIEVPKRQSKIHVYYLENANAEEMANVLSGQVSQIVKEKTTYKPGAGGGGGGASPGSSGIQAVGRAGSDNITITPDKATNALVIAASPEDFETIKDVIKLLDIPRSQVLVEAVIMEVNFTRSKEFGVDLLANTSASSDASSALRSFSGTSLPLSALPNILLGGMIHGAYPDNTGLIIGKPGGAAGMPEVATVIKAIQANSDVDILSTPSILTMDNQEAEIIVGEERPYLAKSQTDDTGKGITQSFDYKDVGITLRITPHITRGKYVKLELFQEIKNFMGENPEAVGAITTTKRQAKTTVVIENKETIVIGGLISDDKNKGVSKIPCFGDIPLIGWIFKSFSSSNRKTNLVIFITPHIINNQEELKKTSDERRYQIEKNIEDERMHKKEEDMQDNVDVMVE